MGEHFFPHEILHKIDAVISSCKTTRHLITAKRFVDVAMAFVDRRIKEVEKPFEYRFKALQLLDIKTNYYNRILTMHNNLEVKEVK